MAKSFKFRYVNEIVGAFVLIVVALLVAGIIFAGNAQKWFEPVYTVKLMFPPEGSFELQKGAEVRILGALVGNVTEISVDDTGQMTGEATVRGQFMRFVRVDSKAIAKKKFGIAGDAYVEISKGNGEPLPEPGGSLACTKDTEIMDLLTQILDQFQQAIMPTIERVQKALDEYTAVAANLNDPQGNLQQLLSRLNGIAAGLENGEGPAGVMLRDPATAQEIKDIVWQVQDAIGQVQKILADIKQSTVQLPEMTAAANSELQDLPGTALQAQATLRETERLVQALQRHWLIRKYVDQSDPLERVVPPGATGAKESAHE